MEQLYVNYYKIDDMKKDIDSANVFFNKRLNSIGLNKRGVDNVSSSRNYLDSAVFELYGIENTINGKIDKLSDFKKELDDFETAAKDADQRVANQIASSTSSFCYTTGIGVKNTEKKSLWQQLSDWAKDAWEDIKDGWDDFTDMVVDFYQEHKDAIWAGIKLVASVGLCVLAVVAFVATLPASGFLAVCAAIAAGFTLAQSVSDVITSTAAFACYINGDKAGGDQWSERSLKDGFLWVGRKIDQSLGTDYFDNILGFTYGSLEIFSAVFNLKDLTKDLAKSFKLDKLAWKNITKRSWKQNMAWVKSIHWGKRFSSVDNWIGAAKEIIGVKARGMKGLLDDDTQGAVLTAVQNAFDNDSDTHTYDALRVLDIYSNVKDGFGDMAEAVGG